MASSKKRSASTSKPAAAGKRAEKAKRAGKVRVGSTPAGGRAKGKVADAKPAAGKSRRSSGGALEKNAKAIKAAAKKSAKLAKNAIKKNVKKARDTTRGAAAVVDLELFLPLTEGERAEALRLLLEDRRLSQMAKVGRYRVITVEPLVLKAPHELGNRRLARVIAYDYSSDRCVEGCVNLEDGLVVQLQLTRAQPMLAREEEAAAIAIAIADGRVSETLSLGDEPQVAMQYWSDNESDLAFRRRSAAVMFGRSGERPSLVAVVDLIDNMVSDIVPADQW